MKGNGKPALRNWTAAANPLLRKGGAHQKSRKAERKRAKVELRRDTRRGSDPAIFSRSEMNTNFRTDHVVSAC